MSDPTTHPLLTEDELQEQKEYTSLEEAVANANSCYILTSYSSTLSARDWKVALSKLPKLQVLTIFSFMEEVPFPEELADCKNLTSIEFEDCHFTRLPRQFGHLPHLKELLIRSCPRLVEFPSSIGRLKSLEFISARKTGLTSIPEEIGACSELSYLDVSMGHLNYLPDSLLQLSKLRTLGFFANYPISAPGGVLRLPNLEYVAHGTVSLRGGDWESEKAKRGDVEFVYVKGPEKS